MEQPLFRTQVSETSDQHWLGSVRLAYPVSHQILTIFSLSVGIIIFIWLFTGHYTSVLAPEGQMVAAAATRPEPKSLSEPGDGCSAGCRITVRTCMTVVDGQRFPAIMPNPQAKASS